MNTSMKRYTLPVLMSLMLMAVLVSFGCTGTPGKDLRSGVYYEHISGSTQTVAEAAKQVMGEMGYLSISDSAKDSGVQLKYRTAFNSVIDINIEPAGQDHVQVGVYVKPDESEGMSQNILKRIRERANGVR